MTNHEHNIRHAEFELKRQQNRVADVRREIEYVKRENQHELDRLENRLRDEILSLSQHELGLQYQKQIAETGFEE